MTQKQDQNDINRRPLEPTSELEYVAGPVSIDCREIKEDLVQLLMYDLLALDEMWEEQDGLFVPKENKGLSFDAWLCLVGDVRPYIIAQMPAERFEEILKRAKRAELVIPYSDGPRNRYEAKTYSNTLFFGPLPADFNSEPLAIPLDTKVGLSNLLKNDYILKAELIKESFMLIAGRVAAKRLCE